MSFFKLGDLPKIQTRKALLLVDFQNDFVRPSGGLHVRNTPEILEALPPLAAAFRRVGDVVWVRSQYESPQPISDWNFGDRIVLDKEPPRGQTELVTDVIEAATDRDSPEPVDPEAFLSIDSSPCCRAQSPGCQFPAPILAAIDAERDLVLDKTGYSALESSGLVLSFRTRFVTELYLCGSLSNVSVYATALDAVRNGFSVTLIDDCLGFRDFDRHKEAMRRMADILGAAGLSAQELCQELDWHETEAIARRDAPPPKRPADMAGIEGVMDGLEVWSATKDSTRADSPPNSEGDNLMQLVGLSSSRNSMDGKQKVRTRLRRPKRRDPTSTQSAEMLSTSGATICDGDSRIVHDVELPVDAFERIRSEVAWQKMYHLSGQVPRLVAVQGQAQPDGAIPIYRHPADESPPLNPFTPAVDEARVAVERILGHPLNHVLIQLYRDGEDRISEHSDKTLDIMRGSFICNLSLGAQRTMVFRTKTSATQPEEGEPAGRSTQRVLLPHQSLFILGEKTNMRWLHAIRPDKRPDSAKSAAERAYGGERISLTFRHIGTYVNPTAGTIWGQGAVGKTIVQARAVVHGDPAETDRLIRAFGQENRASEFDWDAIYGGGFDVVNFVTASTAQLILSGDLVADLQVRLCLGENGIRYDVVTPGQDAGVDTGGISERPLYVDSDGQTIAGSHAILTHLAQRPVGTMRPGVDALRGGSRLAQIDELLVRWRVYRHNDNGVSHALEMGLDEWERALEGQHYLGGTVLGIDDCSLWPLLRDMVQAQGDFAPWFPLLDQYYHRVAKRAIVRTILAE